MTSKTLQMKSQEIIQLVAGFQTACVLVAGCELDLFTKLIENNGSSLKEIAEKNSYDERALDYLLAALVSQGYLEKKNDRYFVAEEYKPFLDNASSQSVTRMIRHQGNCLRGWSQLAWTVRTGFVAPYMAGVNGPFIENQDFILAMNDIARNLAPILAERLSQKGLLNFSRMLDLGGASGTYSFAFLERNDNTNARATIFDRPVAINEARRKAAESPVGDRLDLYEGDFYVDPYPQGFDFVWISAIIHQQNDEATLEMFKNSYEATVDGGIVAVRDVYINEEHTGPRAAAFFGVNMATRTPSGKVYEASRVIELLTNAGYRNARLELPAEDMTAVIVAEK